MSLLPFREPTHQDDGKPYVSELITNALGVDYIPYAERPTSPTEGFQNNVFRAKRTFDVPWHLRWHFMYAMIGDHSSKDGNIKRRLPFGYSIRGFTSIYDRRGDVDDFNPIDNPWLFATSIDSVEGIGFDGKDSFYIGLTNNQLFGDIHNANKPLPDAVNPVNEQKPKNRYNKRSKTSNPRLRLKNTYEDYINAETSSNENERAETSINKLRFVREKLTKHETSIVYKDVIKELKLEEKERLQKEKETKEEQKKAYKTFLKQIKEENKKPLTTNFNALKKGNLPVFTTASENAEVPGAFPEGTLDTLLKNYNNVDPTSTCKYKLARITVSFENVQYRIISKLAEKAGQGNTGEEELLNDIFTTYFRMPTAEFLSLPFGAYRYVDLDDSKRHVVQGSNMRLIAQEEILLTWSKVPYIPDAVRTAIGSVNDDWFPISHLAIEDKLPPDLDNRLWAAPGTLLCTNIEIKPYKGFFSRRNYDINFKFKYFHATEPNSEGKLEQAYSDTIVTMASDPCKPSGGDRKVCQKQAKGHNFFLKYLFVNVTGKTTNDVKKTTNNSGEITTTITEPGNPYSGDTQSPCSFDGKSFTYKKCDPQKNTSLFVYEYITHDGCPTGKPVYPSSNFRLLFLAPSRADNNCGGSSTKNHPALGTGTIIAGENSGGDPFASLPSHSYLNFSTPVNNVAPVMGSVTKPITKNNRLRK
jgi:hypothetical protein